LLGDPGALQRMLALGIETFDGGDFFAGGLGNRGLTGARRLTIEVDRAGAAQASAASELVPVICKCSRMTHNRGVSFGASTEWSCPLIFRVTILPPMAVLLRSRIAAFSSATSPVSASERHVPPLAAALFGFIAVPVVFVAVQNALRRTALGLSC